MLLTAGSLTYTNMKSVLCTVFFIALSMSLYAQDQCKPQVKYTVKEKSSNSYSISLQSNSNITSPSLELYDLYEGKVVDSKQVGSIRGQQEIFKNVKPSLYIIYIKQEGCTRPFGVGGKEGIKVGSI
jgi:hypothetical protein